MADLIFIRNTFHHLPKTSAYFTELGAALKSGGAIAVIDYRKSNPSLMAMLGHSADKNEIINQFQQARFEIEHDYDFLPEQNFLIFHKASDGQRQ